VFKNSKKNNKKIVTIATGDERTKEIIIIIKELTVLCFEKTFKYFITI